MEITQEQIMAALKVAEAIGTEDAFNLLMDLMREAGESRS